jgi:hypothetical protein
MQDVTLPEDDDEQSGTDSDDARPMWHKPSWDSLTNSDGSKSVTGSENEDSAAMLLSNEVSIAILYACELTFENLKVTSLITNKQQGASKSCGTSKSELARDIKQISETPTWANLDVEDAVSESIEDPLTGGDSSEPYSDNEGTAPKLTSDTQTSKTRSSASLV